MHQIVLWKWRGADKRERYTVDHVRVMVDALLRNIVMEDWRVICITDDPSGDHGCPTYELWDDLASIPNATHPRLPSCYRRLKLYDHSTQIALGIKAGDRIVSLDLDTVITGELDDLLFTEGRYVGWEMAGPRFNGSLQMFTAGDLQEVWSDFDPMRSPQAAYLAGYPGSDQAWLSKKLMGAKGSVGLKSPMIQSYALQAAIQGPRKDTALVFFHGTIKPWMPEAQAMPWVANNWRLK